MDSDTLSLYELNTLVRSVLEKTLNAEYWLEAELSEARLATNGHFYVEFVQKDASGQHFLARARGTMWARTYHMLAPLFERATGEHLRAGMKVRVLVTVEFHELYGYSLNVVNIDPTYTLGDLAKRRREILLQLEADGILEDNRRLALPALMKHIAVISSAGAAGYGDFCDQLERNDYGLHFDTRLFPAVMQGANVEDSVLAALEAIVDDADRWDCVVIIRGGGATSDLADFDTYSLAAAVAQMPIPVVVGIGHERDETVLDFVAHTRVKTPTAAAAFLIDHGAQQLALIDDYQRRILQYARSQMEASMQRFDRLATLLPRAFALVYERQQHRLERLKIQLSQAAQMKVQSARFKVQSMEARLAVLDPVLQLRRGYSLTYTSDGRLVRSVQDLKADDMVQTRIADGTITSSVQALSLSNESS